MDVRVVVPGKDTDLKAIRYGGRRNYRRLLEAGVRICEFQPSMLHSKVMLVDGLWCSIGSINFTSRSMKSNAEANVTLYDRRFAGEVQSSIEADLAHCEIITLEQWKQRGLCERTRNVTTAFTPTCSDAHETEP